MKSPFAAVVAVALCALAASATQALAAWPNSPYAGLPVCTSPGTQMIPATLSDGLGGAFLAWTDYRSGAADIYAQHVLASGAVDPSWPANGRAVCTAAGNQIAAMLATDGAGGAILLWGDYRNGTSSDLYSQHVLASGIVDPSWPVDGRAVCTATGNQDGLTLLSDGAGGAFVAWFDYRGGAQTDIYAQHVLASGIVDTGWPVDGLAVCVAANLQYNPVIASDGAGGVVLAWIDSRSGAGYDIYAQHVLASGIVDAGWPVDGRAVCTATGDQLSARMIPVVAGGVLIAWTDTRSGTNDIYAQHVFAGGAVDANWPSNGRALCTAAGNQISPVLVSDGADGAIVAWQDNRAAAGYDLYAQHVLTTGVVDAAWPADGQALCTAALDQTSLVGIADGSGGALFAWQDGRNTVGTDIYAQHLLGSGIVDPAWTADGRAVCTAGGAQTSPSIAPDGGAGALITWGDTRSGGASDIYAGRVARYGYLGTPEAEIAGAKDITGDNGGKLKLSWNASYLDQQADANVSAYDILRSVPPNTAARRLAQGESMATSLANLAGPGRMIVLPEAAQGYYWELLGTVAALHYVSGYSFIAPTLQDSIGAGNPKTAFMVVARNASDTMYWPSRPDSGYSVDNLPPVTPAPFTANYAAGTTHLHWNPNTDADLAGYRLYRGASPSFTPSPATQVAAPSDTGWADAASATYTYKLTAVDVHGNESPVATLTPADIAGVGDGPALRELALAPASPNPAARGTTLRFALPAATNVSLRVYDAAGRLVRTLASGALPAGEHAATWDLRNANGHTVGAGLYFARLEAGARTLVRRVAVTP